jgi:sulfite exporter TauE/SafE
MKSIGLNKFLRTLCYVLGLILALTGLALISTSLPRAGAAFAVGIVLLVVGSLFADHAAGLLQSKQQAEREAKRRNA